MSSSKSSNIASLLPPTQKKMVVKDSLYLVFEVLRLLFIVFPYGLLLSIFKKIFPPAGKSLKGQVVIVTGAGRGLGRGLALRFAKEGAKVAVVDINTSTAEQTVRAVEEAGGTAKSYMTNIGSIEDIHQLQVSVTKDLGPVDILVNNAGLVYIKSLEDMSEADVRCVLDVNLFSHFWMAQEFLPGMRSRNSGHIVAISSLSALAGLGYGSSYTASKCGLMGFMNSLREELKLNPVNNIKTTTVLPYFINTSEDYTNQWDLRFPPLSIEEVVEVTIRAVRLEKVIVSVPECFYYYLTFLNLLPEAIQDAFYSIFYFRMVLQSTDRKAADPSQCISNKLTKKSEENINGF